MRTLGWLAAVAVLGAALAACGGGGDDGDSAQRAGVAPSCDSISKIDSYRYQVKLQLQSPAFEASAQGTPAPPLQAFADALTALFSDMDLDGAYVAPDRSQVILKFQNEELELRAIGDKAWVRVGEEWQEEETTDDMGLLTPDVVCRDIVEDMAPALKDATALQETVNGIDTDHYRLDRADIKQLPKLLGATDDTNLPESFQVDAWLAHEGGWPVRLRINSADVDPSGNPAGIDLFMEFRDINDPGISVEPPVVPS